MSSDNYKKREVNNSNLLSSKAGKQDEFYTQYTTIQDELSRYPADTFEGKTIYCNCDNPHQSNFWKYFYDNFNKLALKRLICTYLSYGTDGSYKTEFDGQRVTRTPLREDGDFRSEECVSFMQEADIVVTNPPYSLMNEYLPFLIQHNKKFIILGNLNHITLKKIKEMVLNEKCWLGFNSGHFWFTVPDDYEEKRTDFKIDENGTKWRRMGNSCWFTNIEIQRKHELLSLTNTYTPTSYVRYDDMDAIEVPTVKDLPKDYYGVMGVSITYMAKHNPEQFKIIDIVTPKINGKSKYKRLLIQRTNKINTDYART